MEPTHPLMPHARDDQVESLKGIFVPAAEGYSSRLPDDVGRGDGGPVHAPAPQRGARVGARLSLLH